MGHCLVQASGKGAGAKIRVCTQVDECKTLLNELALPTMLLPLRNEKHRGQGPLLQ